MGPPQTSSEDRKPEIRGHEVDTTPFPNPSQTRLERPQTPEMTRIAPAGRYTAAEDRLPSSAPEAS
eukprot:scaffold3_cov273-Pinguiococcus_pyrenoidosus.AAC.17